MLMVHQMNWTVRERIRSLKYSPSVRDESLLLYVRILVFIQFIYLLFRVVYVQS